MKHIFVRPAQIEDEQKFSAWTVDTKQNLHDADVLKYRDTVTWCAYDKEGPLVFVPVQRPRMMEALAIRPNADPVDVAVALKELTQNVVTQSHLDGCGEIYMFCKEQTTIRYAERQLFQRMEWPCYRVKVADLEKP